MERTISFFGGRGGAIDGSDFPFYGKQPKKGQQKNVCDSRRSPASPSGGTAEQEVAPGDATVSILIIPLLSLEVL